MTISLRLDRPAMAELIEKDPEFKLELQRCVVAEVLHRFVDKDVMKIIVGARPDLMKAALDAVTENKNIEERIAKALTSQLIVRPPGYSYQFKLTPDTQKLIDTAVANAEHKIKGQIEAAITERATELVNERLAAEPIDERIAKRVDRLVDAELERRVLEHRERLMDKIKLALG